MLIFILVGSAMIVGLVVLARLFLEGTSKVLDKVERDGQGNS